MIGPEHSNGKMPHVYQVSLDYLRWKSLFLKVENLDLGRFWKWVCRMFQKSWSNNQGIDNLCYSSMVPGDLFCISGILKKERANHVQETSL